MNESIKPTAIVTGASSGIGRAIAAALIRMDYEVFGFGRQFEEQSGKNEHFHPIVCDLLDTEKLCTHIKKIAAEHEISVLVNNAGIGYYGLHEELNPKKIQDMVRTNLEVPMILSNLLLRTLKKNKGTIINISSVTAVQSNPHGCAYGATKSAVSNFSRSLFDETRKYGVKVINIQPDMTQTKLYRNADFCEGEEENSYLLPEEVAQAIEFALSRRDGMVISEITLKPQIHRIQRKK
jgi:short-subunit dehydrogenase